MGSPNSNSKKSMSRNHICSKCGKRYAMKHALDNHEKNCSQNEHLSIIPKD